LMTAMLVGAETVEWYTGECVIVRLDCLFFRSATQTRPSLALSLSTNQGSGLKYVYMIPDTIGTLRATVQKYIVFYLVQVHSCKKQVLVGAAACST